MPRQNQINLLLVIIYFSLQNRNETTYVTLNVTVHLFTLIQLQYNNNKEKKRRSKKQSQLYIELNITKEKSV